jgi:hypothetical protein
MRLKLDRWLLISLALMAGSLGACGETLEVDDVPPEPELQEESPCVTATRHVAECLDEPVSASLSCDELDSSGKADWFGDWLCGMGFLYRCPAPVCNAAPDPATLASCSDYIELGDCGSCAYYACRDAERPEPCGEEGYYLGFVGRYCTLFSVATVPRLSSRGQEWIADVRTCLQESMEYVGNDVSCSEVKRRGYDAHPGCYVDTGFCELPLSDVIAIANTVSPLDLGGQAVTTALECVRQWVVPETREVTTEGLERLEYEMEEGA